MAHINLPSLDDILAVKDPKQQMEALINTVGLLMKSLTEINGYLSSKNIKELTADKISAGTINTGDITIGADDSGRFYRIDGNGIVANNGTNNTMVFDLATGQMTLNGVKIESTPGTYPKVVMDPTGQLFAAYTSADTYVGITPNYLGNGPGTIAVRGGLTTGGSHSSSSGYHLVAVNDLRIEAGENIIFSTGGLDGIQFPSWGEITSAGDGQSLQGALDDKADLTALAGKATAGVSTGTGGGATLNGGIPIGSNLALAGGGSVTWSGITVPSHSHTQN